MVGSHAQAVVLLTAHLPGQRTSALKPLTPTEWGRFAAWLKSNELQPEALLLGDPARLLATWTDKSITAQRVQALLDRGTALAIAQEKWDRAGLWLTTRSSDDYPTALKRRLGADSPPVLFGCGNRDLLRRTGLAVVGSRDASEEDLSFATELGIRASAEGVTVVSGGARGIDTAAMLGALTHGGTAIGVIADGLLRASSSSTYRPHLMSNDLVLISPFNPEAGFDVGNAMARNRYIYCLADGAVIVSSGRQKGGTWSGAVEALRREWVPVWVKPSSSPNSGSQELVRLGARELPSELSELSSLFQGASTATEQMPASEGTDEMHAGEEGPRAGDTVAVSEAPHAGAAAPVGYDHFLQQLRELSPVQPIAPADLLRHCSLTKVQMNTWLKRAVGEGHVQKLHKPVRYRWQRALAEQSVMFDNDV